MSSSAINSVSHCMYVRRIHIPLCTSFSKVTKYEMLRSNFFLLC